MIETTAEDALCDALLGEFGLGEGTTQTSLTDARDRMRHDLAAELARARRRTGTTTPPATAAK